jgi:hypothetical protein
MAVKLTDAPLPKSRAGRRGTEIDTEVAAALAAELRKAYTVEVGGEKRPRALGSPDSFDTNGKAGAAGRRYATAVSADLGQKVRVSVYSQEKDKAPFYWRIYIPLSASEETSE